MKKQSMALSKGMVRLLFGLTILSGSVFVSCSEDEKDATVVVEPFKMELEVPAAGETKSVEVEAIADWKLSTTNSSMIKIISPKVGNAGKVKIEFEVNPNNMFTSRSAEINFIDSRNNVIKVIQGGANPNMSFSKPLLVTYDAKKGLFTDTVVVTSNLSWEIPSEYPQWIEEMKMIDGTPQENTTTNVKLVVIAKQDALKPEGNVSTVVLATKNDTEHTIELTYEGFTPKVELDVEKVVMHRDELNSHQYIGHATITSNVKWTLIQNEVVWLDETDLSNNKSQNAIETSTKVWFTMAADKLDTDGLSGTVLVKDINSELSKPLVLEIQPLDAGFVLVKSTLTMADADVVPATNDPETAAGTISVYAKNSQDYLPAIFLMENGRAKESRLPLAFIEPKASASRAALDRAEWQLFAADRSENESHQQMDPYLERMCAVVFLHKSMFEYGSIKEEYMEFDENWNGYLKEEYFKNEVMYRQQGLTAADPEFVLSGISDGGSLTLNSNGGSQFFQYELNFNIDREGVYVVPAELSWSEIYFDTASNSIEIKSKPNTTGASRMKKIEFIHGKTDKSLFTVTLVQPAN
ncbi:MAG: hypothetical protein ACRCSQ_07140 [Bacteroidales bacterium]